MVNIALVMIALRQESFFAYGKVLKVLINASWRKAGKESSSVRLPANLSLDSSQIFPRAENVLPAALIMKASHRLWWALNGDRYITSTVGIDVPMKKVQ